MSILIRGIEMPPQGEFKHIRIYDNGEVTVQVDTGKEVYEAVIANAVSVPPHGDLIDRDALAMSDHMVGKLMMYGGEYVYTQSEIDNAPTVIPAEDGKT